VIERIIENWLTNTNERGYQIPLAQILMLGGHTIVHVSKHGLMEQGKDLITIDSNHVPCAYQLKTGNIDLERWRKIKPQIEELVELPIIHPSVDAKTLFKAFLVTNGEIEDTVRIQIADRNRHWLSKGYPALEVMVKGQLLKEFIEVCQSFFPEAPPDLKNYLDLYLSNGRGLVNRRALALFLEQVIFGEESTDGQSPKQWQRRISGSAVIMQQLTYPFERAQNHVGIVENWVIFLEFALALVERFSLPSQICRPTYEIVMHKIQEELEDLKMEFLSRRNYLEEPHLGDGGILYKARFTIVAGWLCARELYRLRKEKVGKPDESLLKILQEKSDLLCYWGESGTSYLAMTSLLCEVAGKDALSWDIVLKMLAEICETNTADDGRLGFPDPYTPVEEVLMAKMPFHQPPQHPREPGRLSYHLAALVYLAVRKEKRIALNELWKKISRINLCEYDPAHKWQYLTWRSSQGKNRTWLFKETQSWSELKNYATSKSGTLPPILYDNPEFLYYFPLVNPHRLTSESLRLIHETLKRATPTSS
jgi:hypothetical protein